ncbi:MAG: hypothetical protein AAF293_12735 [Pseudomonadota bacterium]
MPITYCIFEDIDLCYAIWLGKLTTGEVRENFHAYLNDPKYKPGRTELIDLSRLVAPIMSFTEMQGFLMEVNEQPVPEPGQILIVVFAPTDFAYGQSRMFQTLASLRQGVTLRVCRSEIEALAAAGRPEKTISEFLEQQTALV